MNLQTSLFIAFLTASIFISCNEANRKSTKEFDSLFTSEQDSMQYKFDSTELEYRAYGSHCGFAGQNPTYREKQLELYKATDVNEFTRWLYSNSTVVQLYAAEAHYKLKAKGVEINPLTFDLIELKIDTSAQVTTCGGCSFRHKKAGRILKQIKAFKHRDL